MAFLKKFLDLVDLVVSVIIGGLLAVTVLLIGLQVFSRYLLDFTPSWSEELARYANVWITLLGACMAIRIRAHISLDYSETFLSGIWKKAVRIFNALAVLLYFALLGFAGFLMTLSVADQTSPGLEIAMWVPYSVLAISGILAVLYALEALFKDMMERV